MKGNLATIFNIQKYSLHDGPGIRTTVFFKGCPLSCKWCHNPESISKEIQIVRNESSCRMCGSCIIACPTKALKMKTDTIEFDRYKCISCGNCEDVCYHDAIKIVGKEMSVEEVLKDILKDKVFYDESGGGVTFSGGEPLMQSSFLLELAKRCKFAGIHTTLDTSGFAKWETLKKIIKYIDLILYDLKIVDEEKHIDFVGASNKIIIENLQNLKDENVDIFLRLPIIKGINDSVEEAREVLKIIDGNNNIKQINLLEYHKMGMEKYPRLGRKYELTGEEKPDKETIDALKDVYEKAGYKVVIGG